MNIAHTTISEDKPVAIFKQENELKMKCIWIDKEASEAHKLWSVGRSYRVTPDGEYKHKGLQKREATEAEMFGITLKEKLEETQ